MSSSSSSNSSASPLSLGHAALASYEPELALKFADRLPDGLPSTHELKGEAFAQLSDVKAARSCFQRAIELSGDSAPPALFLSFAQTSQGHDALQAYQKAIELFAAGSAMDEQDEGTSHKKEGRGGDGDDDDDDDMSEGDGAGQPSTATLIASAHCAAAELFLTDLCFEAGAEQLCELHLGQAAQLDPNNPEPVQLLASVRISQQRPDEARQLMEASLKLWLQLEDGGDDGHTEPSAAVAASASVNGNISLPAASSTALPPWPLPSYEFRVSTVQLLLELSMFDQAEAVLDGLLMEDDSQAYIWLLAAMAYKASDEQAMREALQQCQKLDAERQFQEQIAVLLGINCG